MSDQPVSSTAAESGTVAPTAAERPAPGRPATAWLALIGSALIVASLFTPWLELLRRQPTGWDLIVRNRDLLNRLDEADARRQQVPRPAGSRLGQRPLRRPRVERELPRERVQQARQDVDEAVTTTRTILVSARVVLGLLVLVAVVPLVRLVTAWPTLGSVLEVGSAVVGYTFFATLLSGWLYVAGIELMGRPLSLGWGYHLASVGCFVLATTYLVRTVANGRYVVAGLVLAAPAAWGLYFARLLELF